MNKIEEMLLEQMEQDKFQSVVADDFNFVDSLIDESDLEKAKKGVTNNAFDD